MIVRMRILYVVGLLLMFMIMEMWVFNINISYHLDPLTSSDSQGHKRGNEVEEREFVQLEEDNNRRRKNNKPDTPKRRNAHEVRSKEKMRYQIELDKGTKKIQNSTVEWYSQPEKYKCILKKNYACHQMQAQRHNKLRDPFPDSFIGACAPSFLIIGTPKSGTTSLYFYLTEHPQVLRALSGQFNKEVRFFAEYWNKGPQWYIQQFPPLSRNSTPDHKVHMMSGEASPTYFYDYNVPTRIKQMTPNAKLIVVLRDPVERTYSDKMQLVANRVNFKKDPFVDAQYQIEHFNACFSKVKKEKNDDEVEAFYSCYSAPKLAKRVIRSHPYVMDSIYIYQVLYWKRHFPKEQLLFIKGEDLFNNPIQVMERVSNFLGLCDFDWSPHVSVAHNKRDLPYPPMPGDLRALLDDFYRPYTAELYKELDTDFGWKSME